MSKADDEVKFVQYLLEDGGKLREYCVTTDHGHQYWRFITGNGAIHYWVDMSRENLTKLGVDKDYGDR